MTKPILLGVRDGVAKLVLNSPDTGNAINDALRDALIVAIGQVASDRSVRAVLLAGAGARFCVGGDIGMLRSTGRRLREFIDRTIVPMHAAMLQLARLPVPVVSAVNGPVGGGGLGLALCADLVLAAESMRLRGGYSAIGLTPDLGASFFLTQRAGSARAKEILFLNRAVCARECLEWGLVNAVHPDERLLSEAESLVGQLAHGATLAFGRIKRLVDGDAAALEEHLALEREQMIASAETKDAREGLAAFLEKRPPLFRGD